MTDQQRGPLERHFTVAEIAKALRVSEMTVRRWINAHRLPAVKLGPQSYRVPESGYQDFVQGNAVTPPGTTVPTGAVPA